jgi:ribosomal protein S18 acetylase RimI-like enzyme
MMVEASVSVLSRVKIRTAVESDLTAMEWDGEYAHFRRLYEEIFRSARRGDALLWVAELLDEQNLIGQLFVQLRSARLELADGVRRAYIYGFRIKPDYRSQGLGTQMLEVAEQDLYQRGYRWVVLNVNRDNPDARRLYEREGYRVTAAEAGCWSYLDQFGKRQEVNEPAWRMEKELKSS